MPFATAVLRCLCMRIAATTLLGIASLSLAFCAPSITIDVCDVATGSLHSATYPLSASAHPVPHAPWLLKDPRILKQVKERRLPPNVDNPSLSPVHRKRAAEGFSKAVTGKWQALVLLVDFSDKLPERHPGLSGAAHFRQLLFSRNVYPTGSMRDWYQENSYGLFDVTGLVTGGSTGWLRAPQTLEYYAAGAAGFGAYPRNSYRFGEDIIALADPYVNYARYDNDRDGTVDALFIVHAGPGAETTGNPNYFHSCLWSGGYMQRDGLTITSFSIEPEDGQIGVFGHEFGHALGLPDLYDYGYDSYGAGAYSMMAFGTWGGGGDKPVHFDAYCKEILGWNQPQVVTTPRLGAPLPQAETNRTVYKLWANSFRSGEYFLVENRQRVGFDAWLPAEGMLIWHIETKSGSNDNQWYPPRPGTEHYLVALEQADAQWSLEKALNAGENGDSFPGLWKRRYFHGTGLLNSLCYDGTDGHVTINGISDSGPTMTADFCGVNRAPSLPAGVEIKPKIALVTSPLKATAYGGTDPDADPRTYQYGWSRWNGAAWTKWSNVTTTGRLEGVTLRPGQVWRARARAYDGLLYGGWRTGPTIKIVKSANAVALAVEAAASPVRSQGAAITVDLSAPAAVEVQICNLAGRVVGSLPSRQLSRGVSSLLWSGSSVTGTTVPGGTYLVKVVATNEQGGRAQALSCVSLTKNR